MNQGARDGKDEGKKESECGYTRVGRGGHGDKIKFALGGIFSFHQFFSIQQGAVNQLTLYVGLQEVFCEGMGRLILVTVLFNCFNFCSIEKEKHI